MKTGIHGLAYRPKVFLMDEPLSNLDARLRMDMRAELKRLHFSSGATTIYVTHDQVEALTMSSNIAVMREGVIQQMDTPDRIYRFPVNLFVADFIGNPKVNLLDGVIAEKGSVKLENFSVKANTKNASGAVVLTIRPEDISISTKAVPASVEFKAYSVLPSGADTTIIARNENTELTVREMGISQIKMDERIWLKFDPDSINLYDKESGNLIVS
jgi:multiple sugar transport system ATP-binding protein